MFRHKKVLQVVLILLLLSGCTNSRRIRNEMEFLKDKTISVNLDSMQKGLNLISSSREQATLNSYTYIKYISSIQCSSCVVKSLRDWIRLQDVFDACKELSLIIIISPKNYQTKRIIDELRQDTIMLENVYVDSLGVFERSNPFLPSNTFLHSFLVDKRGKIRIVGDPTCDELVEGEFRSFVYNNIQCIE